MTRSCLTVRDPSGGGGGGGGQVEKTVRILVNFYRMVVQRDDGAFEDAVMKKNNPAKTPVNPGLAVAAATAPVTVPHKEGSAVPSTADEGDSGE